MNAVRCLALSLNLSEVTILILLRATQGHYYLLHEHISAFLLSMPHLDLSLIHQSRQRIANSWLGISLLLSAFYTTTERIDGILYLGT